MRSFIFLSPDEQRSYCQEAGRLLHLPAESVEKDFWVCLTLRELFALPSFGEQLAFKGGTSLSKCWKLIERFSEDIDLVLDRAVLGIGKTPSKKQADKIPKKFSPIVQGEIKTALQHSLISLLPAQAKWSLTMAPLEEDPDQQTIIFSYPTVFLTQGNTQPYIRKVVKIEMGARSDTEPSETVSIQPYLYDAFPGILGDGAFIVKAVSPLRTFWEKVLLLHEESFRPLEKSRKSPLARHYYDVWRLIVKGVAEQATGDRELFNACVRHRLLFFPCSWMKDKQETYTIESLQLEPPASQYDEWKKDYAFVREQMIIGESPKFEDILTTINVFFNKFR